MPPPSLLEQHIAQAIAAADGWIGFDQFMQLALYQPGLGYYSGGLPKIGTMPEGGSDFVTAPEMSPLFGEVLAVQVAQALEDHPGVKLVVYPKQGKKNDKSKVYQVRRGDSISSIAARFQVAINDVMRWNQLDKGDYLKPGQELTLFVKNNS